MRKKRISHIYILETSLGHYKIGHSVDVQKRLNTFEVKLPFDVWLLHLIEVHRDKVYYYETWLHNFFADARVNGEWFILDYYSLNLLVDYMFASYSLDRLIWFMDQSGLLDIFMDHRNSKAFAYIKYINYLDQEREIEELIRDGLLTEDDRLPSLERMPTNTYYTDEEFRQLFNLQD